MRVGWSLLPEQSWLFRFHDNEESNKYERMIVVSESSDFKTLHLMGWIGDPTDIPWKKLASDYFPLAEYVSFERMRPDGSFKQVTLKL